MKHNVSEKPWTKVAMDLFHWFNNKKHVLPGTPDLRSLQLRSYCKNEIHILTIWKNK